MRKTQYVSPPSQLPPDATNFAPARKRVEYEIASQFTQRDENDDASDGHRHEASRNTLQELSNPSDQSESEDSFRGSQHQKELQSYMRQVATPEDAAALLKATEQQVTQSRTISPIPPQPLQPPQPPQRRQQQNQQPPEILPLPPFPHLQVTQKPESALPEIEKEPTDIGEKIANLFQAHGFVGLSLEENKRINDLKIGKNRKRYSVNQNKL